MAVLLLYKFQLYLFLRGHYKQSQGKDTCRHAVMMKASLTLAALHLIYIHGLVVMVPSVCGVLSRVRPRFDLLRRGTVIEILEGLDGRADAVAAGLPFACECHG